MGIKLIALVTWTGAFMGALGGSQEWIDYSLAVGGLGILGSGVATVICAKRGYTNGRQAWQINKNINLLVSQKLKSQ